MTRSYSDDSAGYERIAADFILHRSEAGADVVRDWARTLPNGVAVLDVGCGHGVPVARVLLDEGLAVHGLDPSPTLADAFRAQFPGVPVECASIETSTLFGRTFHAAIAWGVVFLLEPDDQAGLIARVSAALDPHGSFLFTAPEQECEWQDSMTGLRSVSLGAERYRQLAGDLGLQVQREGEDEGGNHYFVARKAPGDSIST